MNNQILYRFNANSVNGLKVLRLEFDKKLNLITGPNGSGKTSACDTLIQMLNGGLVLKEGEDRGEGLLEIGGDGQMYRIKRVVRKGKTPSLEVTTGEDFNFKVQKPSEFLQKMLGGKHIAISPTMFINIKGGGKARKQILFEALEIDTTEIDNKVQAIKFQRSGLKSQIDTTRLNLKSDPIRPDLPSAEQSMNDLLTKLENANQNNDEITERINKLDIDKIDLADDQTKLQQDEAEIVAMENRLKEMRTQLEQRKSQVADCEKQLQQSEAAVKQLKVINTEPIREEMQQLQATNSEIRKNNDRKAGQIQMENNQDQYRELGVMIKDLESQKQASIDDKMPIPGISIGEDDVYWDKGDGIPIPGEKWSTGEGIYIGAGIRVAQGDKSAVKFVIVDDVSLLDEDNLSRLRKLLNGFQVIEVHNAIVGSTKGLNVVTIEDGAVINK